MQREQLEEARNQIKERDRKIQEMSAVAKRLETESSLLHNELDYVEYVLVLPRQFMPFDETNHHL